jgi:hypothetical protein
MDMSQYAGSGFIKFDDVRDGPVQGKIKDVKTGKFDRPVVSFDNGNKLTLNATNVKTLILDLGPDSRDWVGYVVECFAGETRYQGESKDSVLVRPVTAPTKQELAERAARKSPPPDMDDEMRQRRLPPHTDMLLCLYPIPLFRCKVCAPLPTAGRRAAQRMTISTRRSQSTTVTPSGCSNAMPAARRTR